MKHTHIALLIALPLVACGGGNHQASTTATSTADPEDSATTTAESQDLISPPATWSADERATIAKAQQQDAEIRAQTRAAPLFAAKEWMRHIPDMRTLAGFSLPGTHDSGALRDPPLLPGTAQTQVLSISDQLNHGVRALDLRFKVENYGKPDERLRLVHGIIDQQRNAPEVLADVLSFLRANPSEAVVVSIKNENGEYPWTFEKLLHDIIRPHASEWWTQNTIPALGAVRGQHAGQGKAVLVRRFAHADGGALKGQGIDATDWPDNTDFQRGVFHIDDHYDFTCARYWTGCSGAAADKWKHVAEHLDIARAHNGRYWYWTYTSATLHNLPGIKVPVIGAIHIVADHVNLNLAQKLAEQRGNYGTIMMDLVTPGLIQAVISTND